MRDKEITSRVVVNALICPQEDFAVKLNWSRTSAESETYPPVTAARIQLYEDGIAILDCDADPCGLTQTTFKGKLGSSYKLQVTVPGYGILMSETTIPTSLDASMAFKGQKNRYRHFYISRLQTSADSKSIWIRGKRLSNETYPVSSYYTSSVFVDQVNAANDADNSADKGSTVVYEHFLRIAEGDINLVVPLQFSVYGTPQDQHVFQIIAASDAYDRYMRSRYKQELNSDGGFDNPFTEQITVYSNIANGLGIFAGYNGLKTLKQ